MSEQSWFDPNQTFKNPARYAPLIGLDYDTLCEDLQAAFDEEQRRPERIAEREALRQMIADEVSGIAVFDESPEALSQRITEGFFQVFYLEQLLLTLSAGRDDFFGNIVEVRGLEKVHRLVAEYGGVQLALPHYGPHFLVHLLLSKLGVHCSVGGAMTEECSAGHKGWADLLGIELKESTGIGFTESFGKTIAGLVRQGLSVTLYPEYSRSKRLGRYTTEFLGQTVHLPTGTAKLAKITGRKLVGVRLHRKAAYRYVLEFGPVLSVGMGEDQLDVPTASAEIMAWVEEMVRENPEQWEGWRYYRIMKSNGFNVTLRNLAASRRRMAS